LPDSLGFSWAVDRLNIQGIDSPPHEVVDKYSHLISSGMQVFKIIDYLIEAENFFIVGHSSPLLPAGGGGGGPFGRFVGGSVWSFTISYATSSVGAHSRQICFNRPRPA
jgi:hypothetical protein